MYSTKQPSSMPTARTTPVISADELSEAEVTEFRIKDLVVERQEARKAKNFAEADRIRDELSAMGVVVEDRPEGPRWSYRRN